MRAKAEQTSLHIHEPLREIAREHATTVVLSARVLDRIRAEQEAGRPVSDAQRKVVDVFDALSSEAKQRMETQSITVTSKGEVHHAINVQTRRG
ncbi:MAG TPA: hypothetical protein VLF68_00445 [Candidatus Saccharimonadales bacterium]|nr:hypothetical protein [Candidatus Saccharimonadales bacterium]